MSTLIGHSDSRVLGGGDTCTGMDYRRGQGWGVGSPLAAADDLQEFFS